MNQLDSLPYPPPPPTTTTTRGLYLTAPARLGIFACHRLTYVTINFGQSTSSAFRSRTRSFLHILWPYPLGRNMIPESLPTCFLSCSHSGQSPDSSSLTLVHLRAVLFLFSLFNILGKYRFQSKRAFITESKSSTAL